MIDFFRKLTDTSDFPARWGCGNWSSGHGWLHILSDVAVWGAYMAIPIALVFFVVRRKRDIVFPRIFWLFGAFIAACGTVHLVEAFIFWWPAYRLSGLIKLTTAAVSWATVIALIRVLPEALHIPGLAAVNRQLEREIEERKGAENRLHRYSEELKRSNEELDQFAYVASHDLRAPLRAIDNLSQWIVEDARQFLPEKSERHLEQLQGRVRRMDRILEDLLHYARVKRDAGESVEVDTGAMVREIVQLLDSRNGIRFTVAPDMPTLVTARVPLERCFRNLINNAVKHRREPNGHIEIGWRARGQDFVEFFVTDDGPGIDPKFHQRIFEMFKTLRPRDQVEGSGMGLAFIKKTVECYNGRVVVESAPGEGATFRFTWPVRLVKGEG